MSVAAVRDAYAARAQEYIDFFADIASVPEPDRTTILGWALGLEGRVLDVGCGPGQWTDHLAAHGVDIEGVDPVVPFVDEARRRFPTRSYRVGTAADLGVDDGALGGVLAWFSLIHTPPDELGTLLGEFARCVRPGGGLALGFVEGPELVPFDHKVVTGYVWPLSRMEAEVERAGFAVTFTAARTDPGHRRTATLLARRQG